MTDITDFLLARIAEDEAIAAAASLITLNISDDAPIYSTEYDEISSYMSNWSPERTLLECDARRAIVEAYRGLWNEWVSHPQYGQTPTPEVPVVGGAPTFQRIGGRLDALRQVLQHFALPYSEHADFDAAWRP